MNKKENTETFLVKLNYYQDSGWHGEVAWLEQKKRKRFRSALELMKLIDSVVCSDEPAEVERVGW